MENFACLDLFSPCILFISHLYSPIVWGNRAATVIFVHSKNLTRGLARTTLWLTKTQGLCLTRVPFTIVDTWPGAEPSRLGNGLSFDSAKSTTLALNLWSNNMLAPGTTCWWATNFYNLSEKESLPKNTNKLLDWNSRYDKAKDTINLAFEILNYIT